MTFTLGSTSNTGGVVKVIAYNAETLTSTVFETDCCSLPFAAVKVA